MEEAQEQKAWQARRMEVMRQLRDMRLRVVVSTDLIARCVAAPSLRAIVEDRMSRFQANPLVSSPQGRGRGARVACGQP